MKGIAEQFPKHSEINTDITEHHKSVTNLFKDSYVTVYLMSMSECCLLFLFNSLFHDDVCPWKSSGVGMTLV